METCEARELVWRCARNRDSETWGLFRDRYERWLAAGVSRTLTRYDARATEEEREDLLQEVYCRLLEKDAVGLRRCHGEVDGAVVIYLARIAESVVVDFLRSRGAAKRGMHLLIEPGADWGSRIEDLMIDPGKNPEDFVLWRERKGRFLDQCRRILAGRKTARRDLQVLYMALFEGYTSREISVRLHRRMTPSAVDSLMHRLRRRLEEVGLSLPRR